MPPIAADPIADEGARQFNERYLPPEQRAQQRGILGQAIAGVGRGAVGLAQLPLEAASAIPGVREYTEPATRYLEERKPLPSGGAVESGVEMGVTGLGVAAGAATLGPVGGALAAGGLFGASTFAHTRTRLEQLNETFKAQGLPPLTDSQITLASLGAGAIMGVGQGAIASWLGPQTRAGAEALQRTIVQRFLPAGAEAMLSRAPASPLVKGYVDAALRDIPTFAGAAAGEAVVTQGMMTPEQQQAAQRAGFQTPGAAAAASVAPTAVMAAVQPLGAAALRRVLPAGNGSTRVAQQAQAEAQQARPTPETPTAAPPAALVVPAGESGAVAEGTGQAAGPEMQALARPGPAAVPGFQPLAPPGERQAASAENVAQLQLRQRFGQQGMVPEEQLTPDTTLPTREILSMLGERPLPTQREVTGTVAQPTRTTPRPPLDEQQLLYQATQRAAAVPYGMPVGPAETLSASDIQARLTGREPGVLPTAAEVAMQRARGIPETTPPSQPTEPAGTTADSRAPTRGGGGAEPPAAVTEAPPPPQPQLSPQDVADVRDGLRAQGFPQRAITPVLTQLQQEGVATVEQAMVRGLQLLRPELAAPGEAPPPRRDAAPVAPAETTAPLEPPPTPGEGPSGQQITVDIEKPTPEAQGLPQNYGPASRVRTEENRVAQELGQEHLNTRLVVEDVNAARHSLSPDFPPEKQPRITRQAGQPLDQVSEQKLVQMLAKPDFERMTDDLDASRGAPIRDAEGDVLSGNLRDEFLRRLYAQGGEKAAQWRQQVQARAQELGIAPETIADIPHPVIRRVLTDELTPEQKLRFAQEANIGSAQTPDAASVALQDASRLTPAHLALLHLPESGVLDLNSGTNDAFRRALRQEVLPTNDQGGLVSPEGKLTDAGKQRVTRALFVMGYGAEAGDALLRMSTSEDVSRQRLASALLAKAGMFAKMANEAEQGRVLDRNLGPAVIEAANALETFLKDAAPADFFAQRGMFEQPEQRLSPLAQRLLVLLDDPFYKRSGAKMQGLLQRYIDLLYLRDYDPRQTGFAPQRMPTADELLAIADQTVREEASRGTQREASGPATVFGAPRPAGGSAAGGRAGGGGGVETGAGESRPAPPAPESGTAPGAEQPGLLRTTTEPAAGAGRLTRAQVAAEFPGQRVTEDAATGQITIRTRGGHTVTIEHVGDITPTEAELRLSTGRSELLPGTRVGGRITQTGPASFHVEVREGETILTLRHEALGHFLEDSGLLRSSDLRAIDRALERVGQTPEPETRAEWLAQQIGSARERLQGPLGQVVRTVQQWFDRLARALGFTTSGQVVRRIESGRVFEGEARSELAPSRLRVTDEEGNIRPDATPRRGVEETEDKPFAAYAMYRNTLHPEELAAIEALPPGEQPQFRKERVRDVKVKAAADEQETAWDRNRPEFDRYLQGLHEGKYGATAPQMVALSNIAMKERAYAQVLRDKGQMTPERFQEFEDAWYSANGVLHYAQMTGSEAGRMLRLQQMLGVDPFTTGAIEYRKAREALEKRVNAIPEAERADFLNKLTEAWTKGDYETFDRLKNEIPSPTKRELFMEVYYNSLMSGIGTHSTNFFSTEAYQLFHNTLVRPIAGGIDWAVSRMTGRDRQLFASEAIPAFQEQFRQLPRTFQEFWWLFTGNEKALAIPSIHREGSLTGVDLQGARGAWARFARTATWPNGQPMEWLKSVVPVLTFASRAADGMDVAMRHQVFDAEVAARARREALQRFGAPNEAFEMDYKRTFMSSQTDEAIQLVNDVAKQQTFHDPTGPLARVLRGLHQLPYGLGAIFQLILPFTGTPDRLLARGMELLPGPYAIKWAYDNASWKWGGWLPLPGKEAYTNEAMMMLARQLVGVGITAGMYALWNQGKITAAAPETPAERDAFYRSGKIPYGVQVGDQWYSWRRFEPISLPMGMWTTVFDTLDRRQAQMERRGEVPVNAAYDSLAIAAVGVQSAIHYVLDNSYFAGLANFIEGTAQSRQSGTGDIPRGVMRQVASATVPFIGLQRSLVRAIDASGIVPGIPAGATAIRRPEGLGETIATSWLPLVYTDLAAKPGLDVFGRPQLARTSTLGEVLPVPPISRGFPSSSPELEQAFQDLRYFPSAMSRSDAAGKRYSNEDYAAMAQLRGELAMPRLEQLVQAPSWNRLTPDAQRKQLQNILSDAGRTARDRVMRGRRTGAAAD